MVNFAAGMMSAGMKIPGDIDKILRDVDSDASGQIDYSEYSL